jgi:Mg2+/Co2+ transporter CorB
MPSQSWSLLFFILLLVSLSALLSCAETSFTAFSQAKIYRLSNSGSYRAKIILGLYQQQARVISAVLLGNTLLNILSSALATNFAISTFGSAGVVYSTILMTLAILIFSEVLPKTYAINNPEKAILNIAPFLLPAVKALHPLNVAVQLVVNFLIRSFGLSERKEVVSFTDTIRGLIDQHKSDSSVSEGALKMLNNIMDMAETEVSKIMIHRKNVITINMDWEIDKIVSAVVNGNHSRFPLWKDNSDNIIGVLHIKDLLRSLLKYKGDTKNFNIMSVASEPWFIPETTQISVQLNKFRGKKQHFALVVDEYGTLQGIVTLEDILEEIVGDVYDEHDKEHNLCVMLRNGSYLLRGEFSIRDLNRKLDWNLSDENATTVAGYLINKLGYIPDEGESFVFSGTEFIIVSKQNNILRKIRVYKQKNDDESKNC